MRTEIKSRLTKKDIWTIPNILSFFRILLIPVMVLCYLCVENPWATVGVIVLSGITDVADGYIARKYNMVSDFGKFIDPVADKLTQAAMVVCLTIRYPWMWLLFLMMVLRESSLFIWGYIALRKTDSMMCSKWYGKVSTVIVYAVMFLLFLLPNMPELANTLIFICAIAIGGSMVLYGKYYFDLLVKKKGAQAGGEHA